MPDSLHGTLTPGPVPGPTTRGSVHFSDASKTGLLRFLQSSWPSDQLSGSVGSTRPDGTPLDVADTHMAMAQVKPDTVKVKTDTGNPLTAADLREVVERLGLDNRRTAELLQAVETVIAGQRQLVEESKHEAIRALSEGFAA